MMQDPFDPQPSSRLAVMHIEKLVLPALSDIDSHVVLHEYLVCVNEAGYHDSYISQTWNMHVISVRGPRCSTLYCSNLTYVASATYAMISSHMCCNEQCSVVAVRHHEPLSQPLGNRHCHCVQEAEYHGYVHP